MQPASVSFDWSQITEMSGWTTVAAWSGLSGRTTSKGAAYALQGMPLRNRINSLRIFAETPWCRRFGAGLMSHATPSISSHRSSSLQVQYSP